MNKKEEKMSLDEYKEAIYRYLIQTQGCSVVVASELMKKYEADFQEFYDGDYDVETAGCGMAMNLL